MVYPEFIMCDTRGILPTVRLPMNYKSLVPRFYQQERQEEVTLYAQEVEKTLLKGGLEIKLNWDKEVGLKNINIGISGGFDLEEENWPSFREHNLGGNSSIGAGMVAMKYVLELLKTQD